ncbi:hypothetical protein BD626DRAFT_570890 [Schizophyllum amplum]|uniref:Uncharacterized protein n=1 Tax=Schizophyllum amplum TaxID=97359 RepID=A0A550C8V9_9AGAR|nr:hypothetical protein BD626DRAFT_570890 [Auriculariopsis ampla]
MASLCSLVGPSVTIAFRIWDALPKTVAGHVKQEDILIAEAHDLIGLHMDNMNTNQLRKCRDELIMVGAMRESLLDHKSFPKRLNPCKIWQARTVRDIIYLKHTGADEKVYVPSSHAATDDSSTVCGRCSPERPPDVQDVNNVAMTDKEADAPEANPVGALRTRLHVVSADLAHGTSETVETLARLTAQIQGATSQMQTCQEVLAKLQLEGAQVTSYDVHSNGHYEELTGQDSLTGVSEADASQAPSARRPVRQSTTMTIGSIVDVCDAVHA